MALVNQGRFDPPGGRGVLKKIFLALKNPLLGIYVYQGLKSSLICSFCALVGNIIINYHPDNLWLQGSYPLCPVGDPAVGEHSEPTFIQTFYSQSL